MLPLTIPAPPPPSTQTPPPARQASTLAYLGVVPQVRLEPKALHHRQEGLKRGVGDWAGRVGCPAQRQKCSGNDCSGASKQGSWLAQPSRRSSRPLAHRNHDSPRARRGHACRANAAESPPPASARTAQALHHEMLHIHTNAAHPHLDNEDGGAGLGHVCRHVAAPLGQHGVNGGDAVCKDTRFWRSTAAQRRTYTLCEGYTQLANGCGVASTCICSQTQVEHARSFAPTRRRLDLHAHTGSVRLIPSQHVNLLIHRLSTNSPPVVWTSTQHTGSMRLTQPQQFKPAGPQHSESWS